ncbi:ABC transporter substrate-binding protein [Pseudomonas sp.]|uniref:ABC transporter substrate-binding protein n=1 Tax=Pseudomonas sp. TaxID=306 RepID=UPI0026078912|nr:ABC transporter substrate-binding protein [Pseudomonas sp.]
MSVDVSRVLLELAPTGELRVAINLGNPVLAQRNDVSGELTGVSVALAQALAVELGVTEKLTTYDAAGKVFAVLDDDLWDLAFLAIEPARAQKIAFSTPYVIIDGTYLVREDSRWWTTSDLDEPGTRIAVGQGAAYDLFLSRTLNHATLVRAATSSGAVAVFLDQKLDAVAGVRQPLEQFAKSQQGLRVLVDSFTEIRQAMAVPKHRSLAAQYIQDFIERQVCNGFVAQALIRSGQPDAQVASPRRLD